MSPGNADHNLLMGILAYQNAFITKDQLLVGMQAWLREKAKSLADILRGQGVLDEPRRALLDALVDHHIKQHGDNPQQSLHAVSSPGSVHDDLKKIVDADLQGSLIHLGSDSPTQTAPHVGARTSSGLRFRILRPHRKGGLGEVFVAHDEELHREVALKEIQIKHAFKEESRSRFLLEAEITGGLEHPCIVPVYGLGQYGDGRPFYAMRFIRGDSLMDAIRHFHQGEWGASTTGERGLELRQLLGRFVDVCQAIQYAHDRGVVHRDLKPSNIMLGKYGETLVVDWGLAKAIGRAEPRERTTINDEPPLCPEAASGVTPTVFGSAMGTPQYMSPEQAAGRLDLLGPLSDIYSLGATLYCLLTGKAPVEDSSLAVVMQKVQQADFPRPRQIKSAIDPALEAICLKSMARIPADRYASARALADDLENWLADEPVTARREPVAVRAGRWIRKHKPLVSGAAAGLLVAIIGLIVGIWYENEQQVEAARKQTLVDIEEARKLATTEAKIRQSLEQTARTRGELHKLLERPGGVHELLNQPIRWKSQIDVARGDLQRAKDLVADAGAALNSEWKSQLDKTEQDLARDESDYVLAVRLENLRLKYNIIDSLDKASAGRAYSDAFTEAKLPITQDPPKDLALAIQQSPIREQIMSALDHWIDVTYVRTDHGADNQGADPAARHLVEVARLADTDPWRNSVRDAALQKDLKLLGKLADDLLADRESFARLSPQMLAMVGERTRWVPMTGEAWLRAAQAIHPDDYLINFVLADWLKIRRGSDKESSKESVTYFRIAVAIRPNRIFSYVVLADALDQAKDHAGARIAFDRALAIDPKDDIDWDDLASLGRRVGRATLIDIYKKFLTHNTKYGRAWKDLGDALAWENACEPESVQAYKKSVEIGPETSSLWYSLGNVLKAQKDLPAAIDAYVKAVALDPKYFKAWESLGDALRDRKDLDGAIDAYKKAVALDPKYFKVWESLGNALRDRKDLDGAIDAYKKAIAADPKDVWTDSDTNAVLGDALFREKKYVNAEPLLMAAYEGMKENETKLAQSGKRRLYQIEGRLAKLLDTTRPKDDTRMQGKLDDAKGEIVHEVKLTAGIPVLVAMQSRQFINRLQLQDAKGKTRAEKNGSDSFRDQTWNSMLFIPKEDGVYRLIATSYYQTSQGEYEIMIRQYRTKKSKQPPE